MANSHYWPSMTDYQEALQSPSIAFTSTKLRSGTAVENNLGLPRPICGTFASVYELVDGRRRWAVKCFLRNTPDLHERYSKISDHLRKCKRLGYFVAFEYQQEAIRVRGELFPLVKMDWIEASQLNTYIEENLFKPSAMAKLDKRWRRLVGDLKSADIAHGDLQHGNVLVRPNGDIRLIDYDGMWVPTLKGQKSNEIGHPDFQNPRRTQNDFHLNIDEFSAAIIQISISALRRDRSLWEKYNNGDNLLFRRGDFLNPHKSLLINDLRAINDQEIQNRLDFIIKACGGGKRASSSKRQRETPGKKPGVKKASNTVSRPDSWLNDHVEDFGSEIDNNVNRPPPQRPVGFGGRLRNLFRS